VTTLDGLPAHVLLVHAVVALVPVSALLVLLVAVWPAARRQWAVPTAVLAVATAVCVPLATESGEWLERRVESTTLLREHTELGDTMVPWAIALAVVAVALGVRQLIAAHVRRQAGSPAAVGGPGTTTNASGRTTGRVPGGRILSAALAVLAAVVAVGSVVTVYRVGDSGARAAWTGRFSDQPHPPLLPPDQP
jgi:hypothetical protein